jgi:hypothetical protein
MKYKSKYNFLFFYFILQIFSLSTKAQDVKIDEKSREWINSNSYVATGNYDFNGRKTPFVIIIVLDHSEKKTKIVYNFTNSVDLNVFNSNFNEFGASIKNQNIFNQSIEYKQVIFKFSRNDKIITLINNEENSTLQLSFIEFEKLRKMLSLKGL